MICVNCSSKVIIESKFESAMIKGCIIQFVIFECSSVAFTIEPYYNDMIILHTCKGKIQLYSYKRLVSSLYT